jgi:hypothetical protein
MIREELEHEAQALAVKAESGHALKKYDGRILDQVKLDFEELVSSHSRMKPEEFNDDDTFKRIIKEAIEAKSLALRKLQLYLELCFGKDGEQTLLSDVLKRQILDFGEDGTIIELRTGIRGFPWAQLSSKSVSVDFGGWTPKDLDASQLDNVIEALFDADQLRMVTIGSGRHQLNFNNGWATTDLIWSESEAVQESPTLAALLMRCFTRLTSLNLW